MQFFHDTHIDFIGKRKFWYMISLVVTVAGILVALIRGVQFGIDFEGGTEAAYEFTQPVEINAVRNAVTAVGFEGAEIKSYGGDNQVLIRVKQEDIASGERAEAASQITEKLKTGLEKAFPGNTATLLKVDTIGPKIGKELRMQAFYAVLASIIAILIYVTFRFEFVYGLGAILALVHDVLVAFAFAVIFNGLFGLNLEMSQGMLAAFLTVVGFSINDTVIIFDRIRENKQIHRGENLMMLMNRSINETLPRTINTSLTVALVLFILLMFSGETLQGFAFTMLVGIITGTFSSIYIASAFVVTRMISTGKLDPKAERDFIEQYERIRTERKAAVGARV
jgi:preprotein translocase SecF subunit